MAGARILAGQLAEIVHARRIAAETADGAHLMPLDLHRLVPVPDEVLRLGPEAPAAEEWLWSHWGTTWPLRDVHEAAPTAAEMRGTPAGTPVVCWQFHSADWSPWQALVRLRRQWPALRFELRPEYGEPADSSDGDAVRRRQCHRETS